MSGAAIWILPVVSLLGAIISALHYALRDYNVVRLQQLVAARGGSRSVDAILSDVPGHVLATGFLRSLLNVAITLCSVLLFGVLRPEADPNGGFATAIDWPGLALAFILASAIVYFLGIVLPMSVAEHAGERMICLFGGPLRVLHALLWPIRAFSFIDTGIKRLAGASHVTGEEQLQEEIISVVAEGEREGQIDEFERKMIESIVNFGETTVEEIMTPRTEIEGLELTDDIRQILGFIAERGHSRIPIYQGDLDHIVGILYAKDLIPFIGKDISSFRLKPILRRPVWVPETKPLTELLRELRSRKVHIAIALDEYGGTTGLVTFEDIFEVIVGDIQDEYEPSSDTNPAIDVNESDRSAEIEGRAYITDANAAIVSLGIAIPEGEEYDTVAGYVLATLGHIPVAGETIDADGFRISVIEAEPTRVTKVRIEARAVLEPEGSESEGAFDSADPADSDAPDRAGARTA